MARTSIPLSKLLAAAIAAAALTLTTGCSSLERARAIQDGDAVRVTYRQSASSKLAKQIVNALCTPAAERPGPDGRTEPHTKVLQVDAMQVLLDGLATARFFDRARPHDQVTGVSSLVAEIGEEKLAWTFTRDTSKEEYVEYQNAVGAFLTIYNTTTSYRTSRGRNSVMDRHREQRNLRGARL